MMIYRIFNEGDIRKLACGHRSVIALKPGRKWIIIIDWTTLEHTKLDLATWARIKPQSMPISHRRVKALMKDRLRALGMIKHSEYPAIIKEALSTL